MHWYGGSIAEAVTLSKQKNAIFVVFVEGDNDLSTEMATTIDDTAVVSRLSNQTNFLAVKLKSGTENYTHFAQIYQFVPVPSLFFIGRNGTPLEVVCAGVEPSNLAMRIDRILAEHYNEKPHAPPSAPSSSHALAAASVGLVQAEAGAMSVNVPSARNDASPAEAPSPPKFPKPSVPTPPETPQKENPADQTSSANVVTTSSSNVEPEYEVVCEGDVCVKRLKSDQPSTSQVAPPVAAPQRSPAAPIPAKPLATSPSETSAEAKMERAKELLEAKRREKAEQEKELERQKELERRSTGQGVAELKRWQADQEMKQIQEERRREKLENNLARQRVLDQIAQDRAERRARDSAPPPEPEPALRVATSADGATCAGARVQFKLPDGASHAAHFDAHDTLAHVQRYVANNLQLSSSNFALWTAFPRRELTDSSATLLALELAPSAALLVLPRGAATPSSGPTQYRSVFAYVTTLLTTYIYDPSLLVFNWLRQRLFPPPAVGPRTPGVTMTPPTTPSSDAGGSASSTQKGVPRRRTNVHRLPGDAGNDDDDNNTWNGNSTQQM